MKLFQELIELAMPEKNICFRCECYDKTVGIDKLCKHCKSMLIKNQVYTCEICGKPLTTKTTSGRCDACKNDIKFFKKAYAPYIYEGSIKDMISEYKFQGKGYYYKMFSELILEYMLKKDIIASHSIDCIVSVPLSIAKELERGYNQSDLLAKHISKYYDINYNSNTLIKIHENKRQGSLSKSERIENVKKIFEVEDTGYIYKKNILLVDDILTTGMTADECSRTLLEYGAETVYVITIATGRNR